MKKCNWTNPHLQQIEKLQKENPNLTLNELEELLAKKKKTG